MTEPKLLDTIMNGIIYPIKKITDFLFDKNAKLLTKIGVTLIIIFSIDAIDEAFHFTYFLEINNKIKSIEKVNILIVNTTDSIFKHEMTVVRTGIINHKNIFQSLVSSAFWSDLKNSFNPYKSPVIPIASKSEFIRSGFLFNITAGGVFYFAWIILLPIMLSISKNQSLLQKISISVSVIFACIIMGMSFSYVCSFFPLISKETWKWNYIANLSAQIIFLVIMRWLGGKIKNRQSKPRS